MSNNMSGGSTVAAIATPPVQGAIGVIRVSGPRAAQLAARVFRPVNESKRLESMPGYTAAFGHTFDAKGDIDEAVALKFNAPHSYTGEQVVELSLHGGQQVLRRTLRALLDAGAQLAPAGEFTRRAMMNGKLTLTQAEAVCDIISAQSASALQAANAAKNGAIYRKITALSEQLCFVAASLAAAIDFPEEGEPMDIDRERLRDALLAVHGQLSALIDGYDSVQVAKDGVDCVIVGRPNVGKSTLMNLLTGSERSIVTAAAGTTRDVVEGSVQLDGLLLRLSDTAGLRDGRDEAEQIGIERSIQRMKSAQLILAVFAANEPLLEPERQLLQAVREIPSVIIVNKTDISEHYDPKIRELGEPIEISAAAGSGIEKLHHAIKQKCEQLRLDPRDGFLANERQLAAAKAAAAATAAAAQDLALGQTADAVGVLVEDAVAALAELSGERVSEQVIARVFESFCVGK